MSLKRTAVCIVDEQGCLVWEGWADTDPGMILRVLERWRGDLARVGLETGSMTPWLARSLKGFGLPVVVMDARRAADGRSPKSQTETHRATGPGKSGKQRLRTKTCRRLAA